MSVKDINKTIEQLVKEYKESVLTYEKIIKIFPKAPSGPNIKKLLALIQLYNVTVISSQEQAKRMNAEEAKKRKELREKLIENEDDVYDLLKNKELLEWSRSDSPVRMYLREMGQIPLLTKEEEIEISKKIEMGEDIILDAICYVPYLIDFILEYREPLVNRERKVKELFRNFDDDEAEEEEEEEILDEILEEEDEDEVSSDDDGEKNSAKKLKKLDKRAHTIIEAFKILEKAKKDWLKFAAKETAKSDDETDQMTFNLAVAFKKRILKEALLDLGPTSKVPPEVMQAAQHEIASTAQLYIAELWNLPIGTLLTCFVIYFIGGYFLYSSFYAAIGAAVDNETDSQQFLLPIIMPLILGVYIGFFTVINDPHGTVATIFSIVPLTSPIVMLMRIPFGVPLWQILLSMVLLFGTFLLVVWFASKIYRVGILMYGKKPSWKELYKWLKY